MIATILHFEIGPAPAAKTRNHVSGSLADRGNIIDLHPRQIICSDLQKRTGDDFLCVADHEIGLVHPGEGLRLYLRGAAGYDNLRGGPLAAHLPYRLAGLPHGFGCYSAGIDDDGIVEPGRCRMRLRHFTFVSVQTATEGDDFDAHDCRATSTPLPFRWITPRNSISAGPVIKI